MQTEAIEQILVFDSIARREQTHPVGRGVSEFANYNRAVWRCVTDCHHRINNFRVRLRRRRALGHQPTTNPLPTVAGAFLLVVGVLLGRLDRVRVDRVHHGDVRVPEQLARRGRVDAGGETDGGEGVPRVVDPDRP